MILILNFFSLRNDGTRSSKLRGDALNKQIALDFINNLRQEKEDPNEKDKNINDTDFKPKFHKREKTENVTKPEKSAFQSSHGAKAIVMKTFEFGKSAQTSPEIQKSSKKKMQKESSDEGKSSKSSITLNYYEDEEEEE